MSDVKRYLRFDVLDGLRGVAAVIVVAFHAVQSFPTLASNFAHAHLAVDFFFCLSGFVLSLSYTKRLRNGMSIVDFMGRRVTRLGPMIALGTLIGVIAYTAKLARNNNLELLPELLVSSLVNIIFLPSPLLHQLEQGCAYIANPPTWSLTAEMLASLGFAAVLVRLNNLNVMLVAATGGLVLGLVASQMNGFNFGWEWQNVWVGEVRVWFSFSAGVLVHRSWEYWCSTLPSLHENFAYLIVLLVTLVLLWPFGSDLGWIVEYIFVTLVFPMLVFSALLLRSPVGGVPWLKWLGDVSFPVYAMHYGILRVFAPIRQIEGLWGYSSFLIIVEVIACCLLSWLAYIYIDRPSRAWLESRVNGKYSIA